VAIKRTPDLARGANSGQTPGKTSASTPGTKPDSTSASTPASAPPPWADDGQDPDDAPPDDWFCQDDDFDTLLFSLPDPRVFLRDTPPSDPDAALQWMNARHAVTLQGGKPRVLTWPDPGRNQRRPVSSTVADFADFKDCYANRHVTLNADDPQRQRRVALGPWWLRHPLRCTIAPTGWR
jgi:hypothetical protein